MALRLVRGTGSRDGGLTGSNDGVVIGWIREIVLNAADPWSLAFFLGRVARREAGGTESRPGQAGTASTWPAPFFHETCEGDKPALSMHLGVLVVLAPCLLGRCSTGWYYPAFARCRPSWIRTG